MITNEKCSQVQLNFKHVIVPKLMDSNRLKKHLKSTDSDIVLIDNTILRTLYDSHKTLMP